MASKFRNPAFVKDVTKALRALGINWWKQYAEDRADCRFQKYWLAIRGDVSRAAIEQAISNAAAAHNVVITMFSVYDGGDIVYYWRPAEVTMGTVTTKVLVAAS